MHSYYLHKASLRLAKEREYVNGLIKRNTEGWLPIDTVNKTIDTEVNQQLLLDWESLRKRDY